MRNTVKTVLAFCAFFSGMQLFAVEPVEMVVKGHMMEVPGVYVLVDEGRTEVRCLDRVEAHVENDELVITNRTAFDTVVSVMVENAEDRRKALGRFPSLNWPQIRLKSGGTARKNILKLMKAIN